MNYINKSTNQYPYSLYELKQDHPEVSFPKDITEDTLRSFSVFQVKHTEYPAHDPTTETVVEGFPTLINGEYKQVWKVQPLSPEVIVENLKQKQESLKSSVIQSTQDKLDSFAKTRNYDSILSACTYATSLNPKFKVEGQRCVELRDTTWEALYQILEEVQQGTRPVPSGFEDIEPELPVLTWE